MPQPSRATGTSGLSSRASTPAQHGHPPDDSPITARIIHSRVASTRIAIVSSSLTGPRCGHGEAVVAAGEDAHVGVFGELVGSAEGVPLALHDQGGYAGADQLVDPGLLGTARRMEREGQRQAAHRPEIDGAPGRRAGPCRPATDDQRRGRAQPARGSAQSLVERGRGRGDLAPGQHPRLLEADHGHALPGQRGGQGRQVAGADAAAGTMAEQQGRDRPPGPVGDGARLAQRSREPRLAPGHGVPTHVSASSSGSGSRSSGPLLRTLLTSS